MKKIIAAVIGAVLLIVALFIVLRPDPFNKKLDKTIKDLEAYHMKGTMEMLSGEDVKRYDLDLAWNKNGENENYRVSLLDKNLSQEQIILKNGEGVFVLTPSLNQAFKFKGDWPSDSPKPYLYQSMLAWISSGCQHKKSNEGYFVACDVSYPNSPQLIKQEMAFDKELKPLWVKVFNKDGIEEVKIQFNEVDFKPEFATAYFDVNDNLQNSKSEVVSKEISLPLYPVYVYDARLTNTSLATVGNEERHILEFTGEKSFTIVQTKREKNTEPVLMQVSGELVDNMDVFGAYDGTRLTLYSSDVEFSVYSEDLSVDDMLSVVSSMQVAVLK